MPPRSAKMNRFIFGFQRRVWWPKWTPASSKSFMETTDTVFLSVWLQRPAARKRNRRSRHRLSRLCRRVGGQETRARVATVSNEPYAHASESAMRRAAATLAAAVSVVAVLAPLARRTRTGVVRGPSAIPPGGTLHRHVYPDGSTVLVRLANAPRWRCLHVRRPAAHRLRTAVQR